MTLREQLQQRAEVVGQFRGQCDLMTQEQYVLDRGIQMASSEPLTDEQYAYLRTITGAIECLPKQCFYNAQMMALTDSYNETQRVKYHEGYVFTGIMPILHAWVTLDDKIVDVTLSTNPDSTQRFFDGETPQEDLMDRVLGVIPDGWEYMGVPMDGEYVVGFMLEKMESRSLIDNWQDGWPLLVQSGD
tara:strand:- start:19 stop:582 length:564 start_codon:yes stop_codon:yes gene_type:complete